MAVVLDLAEYQHGVVLTRQLRERGVTEAALSRLASSQLLVPIRRGAWCAGRRPSEWQKTVAVGLLAGPDAALSHGTAARIHRFPGMPPESPPEVSVRYPRGLNMAGVTVHRVERLDPSDVQLYRGVPVTTPARTLVDLAGTLAPRQLARAFDEGLIARSVAAGAVGGALDRTSPRRGARLLRSLVDERLGRSHPDSALEARVIGVLAPLQPFEVHHQLILGGELVIVDIAWPADRAALECDGWAIHSRSRTKFDRDRRRDNLLVAHGWRTGHVTSTMSDREILRTALDILLARRRAPLPGGA